MTTVERTRLDRPERSRTRAPRSVWPRSAWPRRRTRQPVRRSLVLTHRWLSLVLGLVLLVEVVSGVALVYEPELHRALNSDAYAATGGRPTTTLGQAVDTVRAAHPDFEPTLATEAHGVYVVSQDDTSWTVDPATGRVLGHVGAVPGWLEFLANLHECALTCEDDPGYLGFMNATVPHTSWLGDDADVTVSALVLGALGLVLLYLSLSGLWLWFPRPGRWRQALTVRRGRGRFARDTDLHKVIGVAALVPLLMWGFTGAGFELTPLKDAYYAAVPGGELSDPAPAPDGFGEQAPKGSPTLSADQAAARAEAAVPGARVVYLGIPADGDATTPWDVWMSTAHDPYGRTDYPGDVEVGVDQHSGATQVQYGDPRQSTAQWLWDAWSYPVHTGFVVTGWWRLIWFAFGLAPIALAVTGLSTWLVRRRSARARRQAARPVSPGGSRA